MKQTDIKACKEQFYFSSHYIFRALGEPTSIFFLERMFYFMVVVIFAETTKKILRAGLAVEPGIWAVKMNKETKQHLGIFDVFAL
jgi:hypothetical protein